MNNTKIKMNEAIENVAIFIEQMKSMDDTKLGKCLVPEIGLHEIRSGYCQTVLITCA